MGFNEILGQDKVIEQLKKLSSQPTFPPLIFWGREGVGKRTTALIFAQSLNCEKEDPCGQCRSCREIARLIHPDLRILFPTQKKKSEGENEDDVNESMAKIRPSYSLYQKRPTTPKNYSIHIGEIKQISTEMRFQPLNARRRVVIIVDAEKMTIEAANAFLKTLEEPQKETVFILTTTRLSFLPTTIRSRCFPIYFPPLKDEVIEGYLKRKGYNEEQRKKSLIFAYGSLRRAIEFSENPSPIPKAILSLLFNPRLSSFLSTMEVLRSVDLEDIIQNLILLFHSQLLKRLKLKDYESLLPEEFSTDTLIKRMESLLNLQLDLEYNLNRHLFLFSFLYSLVKKPSEKE